MEVFHYNSKSKRLSLFQGIVWLALGTAFLISTLYENESLRFYDYGFILIGLGHFTEYLLVKRKGYVFTHDGYFIRNGIVKKKLKIQEIKFYHYYAGDYTLHTDDKKLKIDAYAFDENTKEQFVQFLEKHHIAAQ